MRAHATIAIHTHTMRHQQPQKLRENSPIAPDIPLGDERDAIDGDSPLSPRSRRRAEDTIARLQQGMLGRARSMFGGRDASPMDAIDANKNGTNVKRPPIKSSHRTLEFFTLWSGGRHKRAATISGGPSTAPKQPSTTAAKSSRDSVLVDNTNRHSHPSTVVRNVSVQKQHQHVSSAVSQRLQQRRHVDHVDAVQSPASMRLRNSDNIRTAHALTNTSPTTTTSAITSTSTTNTSSSSKRRYTRNNSLDESDLGRLSNDHQQRRSSHHHQSFASAYASADEALDHDDANAAAHDGDRHVVFVNKQLFRNGSVGRDDEHRQPIVADGVKRLIAMRANAVAATDKHSIIINNHNNNPNWAMRPSQVVVGGSTQQRAGILQRHNGETVATDHPAERGQNAPDSNSVIVAAGAEIGSKLRVASTLGRPKKKLSFREPVENDSKPFVFKSDTLPRAKRFIATIERQRQQQANAACNVDDQLEVVETFDLVMCGWVGALWVVYSINIIASKSKT